MKIENFLHNCNTADFENKFILILGENGSGKSLILEEIYKFFLKNSKKAALFADAFPSGEDDIILFDNPFCGLSPSEITVSTEKILSLKGKKTIFLSELFPEYLYPLADYVLYMKNGEVAAFSPPYELAKNSIDGGTDFVCFLPVAAQVFAHLSKTDKKIPLSLSEGNEFVKNFIDDNCLEVPIIYDKKAEKKLLKTLKTQSFSVEIFENDVIAVLGENRERTFNELKNAAEKDGSDIKFYDDLFFKKDNFNKNSAISKIKAENSDCQTVLYTNDVEYAANICDRVIFSDGENPPVLFGAAEFFKPGGRYEIAAVKTADGLVKGIVNGTDLIWALYNALFI